MKENEIYNVKLHAPSPVYPNAVLTGRIHPFGDHYRFAGVFFVSTSPLILDPDILMSAYENDGLKKIESIQLRKGSSLQSILNKYPAHWIDWMSKHYGLKERLKKEKIQGIESRVKQRSFNLHLLIKPCGRIFRTRLSSGFFSLNRRRIHSVTKKEKSAPSF
jgi:hypothetical protein